jgi:hypothetical protein
MKTTIFISLAFVLSFQPCILSQNNFDIKHYDLSIFPDFKTKNIKIKTIVSVENLSISDTLYFGLNQNFDQVKVSCKAILITFGQDGNLYHIPIEIGIAIESGTIIKRIQLS